MPRYLLTMSEMQAEKLEAMLGGRIEIVPSSGHLNEVEDEPGRAIVSGLDGITDEEYEPIGRRPALPHGKRTRLMEIIPEPEVARRDWVYVYKSPGGAEWPRLLRKGWPDGNRADKLIVAHELRIIVVQAHGAVPEVQMIRVNGVWSNGNPVRMVTVHHDAKPEQGLIIHAPDWVMELAADAVERSMQEMGVLGQTPITAAEGAILDRISRGEAVPHYSTCARCNHCHVCHRHRTKIKPCERCGCEDLVRRERRKGDSSKT